MRERRQTRQCAVWLSREARLHRVYAPREVKPAFPNGDLLESNLSKLLDGRIQIDVFRRGFRFDTKGSLNLWAISGQNSRGRVENPCRSER